MANTLIVAIHVDGFPTWSVPVTLPKGEVGRGWTKDAPGQASPPPNVAQLAVKLARSRAAAVPATTKIARISPKPESIAAIRSALERLGGAARTESVAGLSGYCVATCNYTLPHVARRVRRGVWSLA